MLTSLKEACDQASSVAAYLTAETGRQWTVIHPEAKSIYAAGADFIVHVAEESGTMIFRNPWPNHADGPQWAFSIDSGDTFAAVGETLLELLSQPGVIEEASGRTSQKLPRDFRDARAPKSERIRGKLSFW